MITSPSSAEAIKYAANASLATRLSFINAVANMCEAVGADVNDVIRAMGYDRRIGFDAFQPGPGWGGNCLPKDTRALIRISEDGGYDFVMLRTVIAVNDQQQERIVAKIAAAAGGSLDGIAVAVSGLTFKAGTCDLRRSPAVAITNRLVHAGARVRAYDPTVRQPLPGVDVCSNRIELAGTPPFSPCSPSGRNCAGWTSRRSAPSWPARASWTPVISWTRWPCATLGSATRGSAGHDGRRDQRGRHNEEITMVAGLSSSHSHEASPSRDVRTSPHYGQLVMSSRECRWGDVCCTSFLSCPNMGRP